MATIKIATATLVALSNSMKSAFVERDDEIDAMLTALVAGEHVLLLGPPGTGKSALINALAKALDSVHFERLFTKYSVPEEVFGPLSLSGLSEDRYERKIEGYLPAAETAFLDEIFKANSAILNSLLSLLNERVFDNGTTRLSCPLVIAMGASNELPENGEGLEALFDRFTVRRTVSYVSAAGFAQLMDDSKIATPIVPITRAEVNILRDAATRVVIGSDVREAIAKLRAALLNHGVTVSDRRWRKSLSLIRASAVIAGRNTATVEDLGVLKDVLWTNPDDSKRVAAEVIGIASPNLADAMRLLDSAVEERDKLDRAPGDGDWVRVAAEANASIGTILTEFDRLPKSPRMSAIRSKINEIRTGIALAITSKLGMGNMGGEA